MKKLFILSVLTLLSTTSYAQLKLHSNGYLSFNTTQTPLSPISINWTGKDGYELSAGIYLYSLVINGQEIDTKKMIITK